MVQWDWLASTNWLEPFSSPKINMAWRKSWNERSAVNIISFTLKGNPRPPQRSWDMLLSKALGEHPCRWTGWQLTPFLTPRLKPFQFTDNIISHFQVDVNWKLYLYIFLKVWFCLPETDSFYFKRQWTVPIMVLIRVQYINTQKKLRFILCHTISSTS